MSQEEGQAAPEEQGRAQDLHPQLGKGQQDSMKARWASWTDWEDLRDQVGYVAQTLEAEQREQGEPADPKGQEKPPEGEQPPGEPTPKLLRDGRATPDHHQETWNILCLAVCCVPTFFMLLCVTTYSNTHCQHTVAQHTATHIVNTHHPLLYVDVCYLHM